MKMFVDPYEYRPDGKGIPIVAGGGVIVARVVGTSYPIGSACESDHALALKMAAAPDLLEALGLAEGWIDAERESEETGEGQQARWILETMRAAIAKATGQ